MQSSYSHLTSFSRGRSAQSAEVYRPPASASGVGKIWSGFCTPGFGRLQDSLPPVDAAEIRDIVSQAPNKAEQLCLKSSLKMPLVSRRSFVEVKGSQSF